MFKSEVAIIGGGIGGLVAALAFLRCGIDVNVYEQASALEPVGAGVQLSANATRVLRWLGLELALAQGSLPLEKTIRLWNTGKSWTVPGMGPESEHRYGAPFLALHRADLLDVLVAAVRSYKKDAIFLNSRCIQVSQNDSGAEILFESGTRAIAKAVIGADGVHSMVRAGLDRSSNPEFTGLVAWRGVVDTSLLPNKGGTPVSSNWIGPGCHVITYPLRRGTLLNFVGIVRRPDWTTESWSLRGSKEECLQDFTGWHEDIIAIVRQIESPLKWALMKRDPLTEWSSGRITLLGDSCHPTLPFLGQGAGMVVEDAAVLARCVRDAESDYVSAFDRYQRARVERTSQIVLKSAAMLTQFQNPLLGQAGEAERYVASQWDSDKVHKAYGWIYNYDAVSMTLP